MSLILIISLGMNRVFRQRLVDGLEFVGQWFLNFNEEQYIQNRNNMDLGFVIGSILYFVFLF